MRRLVLPPFRAFLLVVFSVTALHAQEQLLKALPSALEVHGAALGNRLRIPGKERTVLTGFLLDERGERTPARVIVQLPDLVRLEGIGPKGPPITFDGKTRVFPRSRLEEQLLEIFSSDTAEGMLASIRESAAVQLLGRRVAKGPDERGTGDAAYDIFEVAGPVRSNASGLERLKRYHFDSETGLLSKTQYLDETFSPPVRVETLFSDWRRDADSAYPTRIDHQENGRLIYSFIVTSIVALPRQDPRTFAESAETGTQEE